MRLFSQSLSRHASIIVKFSRRARVSETFLSIQVIPWKGHACQDWLTFNNQIQKKI
jgi:hypothetical protein